MSPSNRHLEWIELRDFTTGLWTRGNSFLIPSKAFQTMQDCQPLPGGGVRAFYTPDSFTTTGVSDIANEYVIGLFHRGGIPLRSGLVGDGTDHYMMTYNLSDDIPRLYRLDGSNGDSSWSLIKTHAASSSSGTKPHKSSFRFYQLSGGGEYVVYALRYVNASEAGVWSIFYDDGSTSQRATATNPALAIHQARLVYSSIDEIFFSDPGSFTFPSGNSIEIEPNKILPDIISMEAQEPEDLLIAKQGAPWVVVQGDLTDPIVTQQGGSHFGGEGTMDLTPTNVGLVFIEPLGEIFATDGRSFESLSEALTGFDRPNTDVVSLGDTAWADRYVFAPSGHVLDTTTGAWFTVSDLESPEGIFMSLDRHADNQTLLAATEGTNFSLFEYQPWEANTSRASTYTIKTAPLRNSDGRQIEIREVQIICDSFNAGAEIDVTVNNTTRSATNIGSGAQAIPFLFQERDEVLDVQVVAKSTTSAEAPLIEAVRIGTGRGHFIR